jgi:ribosomal protein S18 acetylase RimI-like enzyme
MSNPYWPRKGARTFIDPDGYRLIVVPAPEPEAIAADSGGSGSRLVSRVVPSGGQRDVYLPLFDLADDAVDETRRYSQTGTLYGFEAPNGSPIGMILVLPLSEGVAELKAVAVDQALRGRGLGTRLLRAVVARLRSDGVRRVVVGISSSGVGQLAYYQKAGFRLWKVERDFFTPERGYPQGIEENGIPARDMVWMDQDLEQPT